MRLRHEANYWKEQCARVEEETRALLERKKELEAEGRKQRKRLKEPRAVDTELKLSVQLLEALSQNQVPGRGSSDSLEGYSHIARAMCHHPEVRMHTLANPRSNRAIQHLLEHLNAAEFGDAGTNLRLTSTLAVTSQGGDKVPS